MTGVRLRPWGYEGLCEACGEWWPLEPTHWNANSGMRRCYSCVKDRKAIRARKRRRESTLTPFTLEQRRAYNREWMRRYRADSRRQMQYPDLEVVA